MSDTLERRAEARIGTTLKGKYHLERVLGVGGMAVVYQATHRNQASFAIKMLHPELTLHEDVKRRFLREGYAANSVKHPGAVLVVDDEVAENGAAFLVMELLEGAPVDALWEASGNRLSEQVVIGIAWQLLDVLAAAHDKGIIHRDIKPANLFITRQGGVKVLDFGIARARDALSSSAHATSSGSAMGTPAFMAPEQALARANEIDARTDLWAVGATMFTLLSGELVHDGENAAQVMVAAATRPARSLATVAPSASSQLVTVVDRALSAAKVDRWANATTMRDALADLHAALFGGKPTVDVLAALHEVRAPAGRGPVAATLPMTEPGNAAALSPTEPMPRPKTAGMTTAQPVSADRGAPAGSAVDDSGRVRPSRVKLLAVTGAVVGVVAGGWGMWRVSSAGSSHATSPTSQEPTAPPQRPSAPPALPSSKDDPLGAAPALPAPSPSASTAAAPVRKVAPKAGAAASVIPSATQEPAAIPTPSATCRTEKFLDERGESHFRKVCP